MIGKAIISILNADSAYKALIGVKSSADEVKVYPNVSTQGTALPVAVYHVISGIPQHNKDERGVTEGALQIDHVAKYKGDADNLQTACITALDHYEGTVSGVSVSSIRLINEGSSFKYDTSGYKVITEFSFRINP